MNDHRISVRLSRPDELDGINARYDAIDFKRSIDSDLIAIAEVDGEPAGQGRVQHITAGIGELGGMFVDEACRGLGLAGRIIDFLLQASPQYHTLYCLPALCSPGGAVCIIRVHDREQHG